MKFLGNICRKNGIEKQMLCGKVKGRRSRGRQRIKYMDSLNDYVTNKSLRNTELIRKTDNRKEWRAMIVDVCSRPDNEDMRMDDLWIAHAQLQALNFMFALNLTPYSGNPVCPRPCPRYLYACHCLDDSHGCLQRRVHHIHGFFYYSQGGI